MKMPSNGNVAKVLSYWPFILSVALPVAGLLVANAILGENTTPMNGAAGLVAVHFLVLSYLYKVKGGEDGYWSLFGLTTACLVGDVIILCGANNGLDGLLSASVTVGLVVTPFLLANAELRRRVYGPCIRQSFGMLSGALNKNSVEDIALGLFGGILGIIFSIFLLLAFGSVLMICVHVWALGRAFSDGVSQSRQTREATSERTTEETAPQNVSAASSSDDMIVAD